MKKPEMTLGRLIGIISNKLKRSADENLVNENMTIEQLQVLKMIYLKEGEVPQKEIEKEFGVRRSTVTSAMQILEKKGFIERFPDPRDSRAKLVRLTPSGKEKNEKLICFIVERDKKLLKSITKEEADTLMALLLKLLENID